MRGRTTSLLLVLLAGCASLPSLPPIDTTGPGWKTEIYQAVWKPNAAAPELVGELLLVTHPSGQALIEFSKPPFPILSARRAPGQWQIEFTPEQRSFRGRGSPTARTIFPWLPEILRGAPAPGAFEIQRNAEQVRIHNKPRNEQLTIYLH